MGGGEFESLAFNLGCQAFVLQGCWKTPICGVALIFTLLDKVLQTRRWSKKIFASTKHDVQSLYTSNGASRRGVHQ